MKKKAILVSLVMLLTGAMSAWSITDEELVAAAIELDAQGASQQEIASALIRQGATIDQLKKLTERLQEDGLKTATSQPTENIVSERVNNGEKRQDKPANAVQKTVFGQDIFNQKSLTFEPEMNIATPQNYVLGPGDEVIIDIYGASQKQIKQKISPDGYVTVSGYGPIQLSGLTVTQASARLQNTLGSQYASSRMRLSVGQPRTIQVNVMGEVEMPGTYRVSSFASVFHVLYLAGGINELGTLRQIKVYREGHKISDVDLYDYMLNGQMTGNVRMEDGDVVLVGAFQEHVVIGGKIKRPMTYELKKGETVSQLLQYAGGYAADAHTGAVRVQRRNDGAMSVHTVRNEQFEHFALMDGDSVQVEAILPRLQNTVEVRGAVFREGQYGLSEQLQTVAQLIGMADGLTEDAFATRAVLYRMKTDRTYMAIPIALEEILAGKENDIKLKNEDQLFVPSQQAKLDRQYVVIHGEVMHPKQFPFAENESVEDLVLRAGGLTEQASTSKVDVYRRIIDPQATEEQQVKTEVFTIALNDSMLVNDHGFTLQPFDEVYIRQSPVYGKQMHATIRGEILFAGSYALKTKNERLSDLVKMAGGISSHAYAKGARLIRQMTEEEILHKNQLLKINKTSKKDSTNLEKLELSETYYVGIDLEAALRHPGSDEDIVLREGDELFIPSVNSTVKINGEVLYPNAVSYVQGKKANYYISQAGGYSAQARRAHVYVIYPGGKVGKKCSKIEPGCEIVVPSKPERKVGDAAQWVSIASASASLASVAATITTLILNSTKK